MPCPPGTGRLQGDNRTGPDTNCLKTCDAVSILLDSGCQLLLGDFNIHSLTPNWPNSMENMLVQISGSLTASWPIRNASGKYFKGLSFPYLVVVTDDVQFTSQYLVFNISLPALRVVGGKLRISRNRGDVDFDFRSLETVGGDVEITFEDDNDETTAQVEDSLMSSRWKGTVRLESLQTVGGSLNLSNSWIRESVELGALTTVAHNPDRVQ